ncbi:MAG TPA: type I-U CRISPR-associated protein Cas8c, partial [Schlesneria sp.]
IDVCGTVGQADEFEDLTIDQQDIVLHLIGAHHGRARPHFPSSEAHDVDSSADIVDSVVNEIPARFARLQRTYGRWGLAYLESILRAADILDSQRIEATPLGDPVLGEWVMPATKTLRFPARAKPTPSFGINVDPANPGQFFACCGLFELASRLWPGVEGWFEEGSFRVSCKGSLRVLLDSFSDCQVTNTMTASEHSRFEELTAWSGAKRRGISGAEDEYKMFGKLVREAPIVLRHPFEITLDWFVDDFAGGSRFKTWAGQQSVLGIAKSMKQALNNTTWRDEDCLRFTARECGLPFNFDSDLGGQGGAIDVGFSFDPLAASSLTRIEPMARPALELLAFVGLQRFRPEEIKGKNQFRYTAWTRPLPIEVAAPAACGTIPITGSGQFEFRLLYRTKYLKSFLPAIPFSGVSDE